MVPAVGALFCQECLVLADNEAREWRLLRVDVPGEDDEPTLATYCPACGEREFGVLPRGRAGRYEPPWLDGFTS
jgi:hypothetical protein